MQKAPARQTGAILVLAVLLLVVLLGFSALALDLGRLYVLRTEMQNAADAAALAAAAELDREENARADAVLAAKNLLTHRGRFATNPELLNILKYESSVDPLDPAANAGNAFEFYSWINAEYEIKPDSCTSPLHPSSTPSAPVLDTNKCLATGDSDAHYVKVRLHPDLVINSEEYFQISLYLVPVLGLFSEDGIISTASTSVRAVAGAGAAMICNYPPMFMCRDPSWPTPGTDETAYIGKQMRIKVQKDNWAPGNFGFLSIHPDAEIINPKNGHTLSGNQALAATLANEQLMPCTPSTVTTEPGNMVGWTRDGLNTRFGIYNAGLFLDGQNPHAAFAPSPNVIDYPRDRDFTDERYGTGWDVSKDLNPPAGFDTAYIPSTYTPLEYYQTYHNMGATELPAALGSDPTRYNFYQWELTGSVTDIDDDDWLETQSLDCDDIGDDCPNFMQTNPAARDNMYSVHPDQPPAQPIDPNLPYLRIANSCNQNDPDYQDPKNKDCTLLDGAPLKEAGIKDRQIPLKRVLYVAEIQCDEAGIPLNGKTSFDVLEHGRFIKMFLTEHIQPPSGGPDEKVDIYAEYLGPVEKTDEVYQELVHTVIQLYE